MRTIEVELFRFDELDDDTQDKAVERLADINVHYEWWESIYEDAERIGLRITAFDTYRREIEGDLIESENEVLRRIISEHGPTTDTHAMALAHYALKYSGEFDPEDFKHDLLQEYLSMLDREYEYMTSREAIVETIEANEYEFTANGELH